MWTRDTVQQLVTERLAGWRLICVSNREPYVHVRAPRGLACVEPASGVTSALDPVMQATGGTWIAHGSGSGDRETADAAGRLSVPPSSPRYTLRRVWLDEREEQGYYYGLANEALWPLCHIAYERPVFREDDWQTYADVNARFADAVVEEAAGERAMVFIQDYHFALLPALVKQRLPHAAVFQFWHIPWPNFEAFRICPWKDQILRGLCGNDLLAFHIQHHCNNFLETVDRELECRIDRERFTVTIAGSPTLVRPHPISVDFDELTRQAGDPAIDARVRRLRSELCLDGQSVILGVDRLDYTKGVLERIRAVDRLLRRRRDLAGRLRLLQVGVPTRDRIPAYRRFNAELDALVDEVNGRHRASGWEPVLLRREHRNRADLLALYRLADVCAVTSLHDGMNLVAKEFVAARSDLRGVLVLSPFTGAARELTQAVIANPYAADAAALALERALSMPADEQEARMTRMRETVREHNVYAWIGRLLRDAARLEIEPWPAPTP